MNNAELLSLAFLQRQPQAGAALLQESEPQQAAEFLAQLPRAVVATTLMAMNNWPAAKIISELPVSLAADILSELNAAKAEMLMRLMQEEQRAAILRYLPSDTAKSIHLKLTYPLGTVGAWMDVSTPYFSQQSSVADCLDYIKHSQSRVDGVVMVVDDARHLLGLINLDRLLISDVKQPLINLIDTDVMPLPAKATLDEIRQHEAWSHFSTLPVADHHEHILGTLSHSALIDGTRKSLKQQNKVQHLSIMSHMGRALLVTLAGLIHVAWSIPERTDSEPREGVDHD